MSIFDYEKFQNIKLITESEIIAKWKSDHKKPAVSIVCTSFNHVNYIEDALKGFLIQESDFAFEIIIHDDASTDGTAEIIDRYHQKYPNIIKFIKQDVNQYSRGVSPLLLTFELARGDYIAICEGDDYWIHPGKLQAQYAALVNNPDIQICTHASLAETVDSEINYTQYGYSNKYETTVPTLSVVRAGGGFCATAAIMIRTGFIKNAPTWFAKAPVLDVFIQGLAAFDSGVLYLPKNMCVYRVNANGSWTRNIKSTYITNNYLSMFEVAYECFDDSMVGTYRSEIDNKISAAYYSGAISSIRYNKKADFIQRIRRSYQLYPNLNLVQILLYRFNRIFILFSYAYKIIKGSSA